MKSGLKRVAVGNCPYAVQAALGGAQRRSSSRSSGIGWRLRPTICHVATGGGAGCAERSIRWLGQELVHSRTRLPISTIWTLLAASAVLFVAGEPPVRLAFLKTDDSCGYYVLDRVLDAFFMLDVINFVSGYQNADGQLVVELKEAIRYLRSWFILDLQG